MDTESRVPPGFRFHPTDEELVDYYLKKKVASKRIDLDVIRDIDLYRLEPWDLQERCKIGYQEQTEWYFFSHKDKKYPTGTRTNRATVAGFWKATGRDKAIYAKMKLIGMRKTLVFYKGRAPNGQKTDWIMHEYRLETNENAAPQEEGWVVCRAFKKRTAPQKGGTNDRDSSLGYEENENGPLPDHPDSDCIIKPIPHGEFGGYQQLPLACKRELEQPDYPIPHHPFLQLPQLESPKLAYNCNANSSCSTTAKCSMTNLLADMIHKDEFAGPEQRQMPPITYSEEQVTDWRVLDKFVASQLSQEDLSDVDARSPLMSDMALLLARQSANGRRPELPDYASSSNCTADADIWVFEK